MSTFKKKSFIAAAEAYCLKELGKWIASLRASNLEEAAIAYGIREAWLLPNEGLEAITVLNVMPDADVIRRANAVELGAYDITEKEAKFAIAAAVKAGIAEAEAGIKALAVGPVPLKPDTANAGLTADLGPGTEEQARMPAPALQNPATGVQAPAIGVPTNIAAHISQKETQIRSANLESRHSQEDMSWSIQMSTSGTCRLLRGCNEVLRRIC